ncbi:hypothetical protein MGH68_07590 [Erysipelothrix sp. D19-032]
MRKELAQKYNHLDIEKDKYQEWVDKGYFTVEISAKSHILLLFHLQMLRENYT